MDQTLAQPDEIRTTGNQKVAAGEGIALVRREHRDGPGTIRRSSGRGNSAAREPSAKSSRDIKRQKAPS